MANELNIAITTDGLSDMVARIFDDDWVQVGSDIAMVESGSTGRYTGDVPVATLASQQYNVSFYTTGETPDLLRGTGTLVWDSAGDKEVKPGEMLTEAWKDRGLDPDAIKTITEVAEGSDYDEAVDGITKDVTKVGAVTTIDRA